MRSGDGAYPWIQLRYVAKPGTGHTPSRERPDLWRPEECTIPWFTLADVWQIRDSNVTVVENTAERVSSAGIAASAAVRHPVGTVLLSRTASVGFSAVMGVDMAVSQDYMTWTPGPRIEPRFLLYVLRGLRPELDRLMTGSTHKTIYMPDLLALRGPVPPVAEQHAIADFLDRECEKLRALRLEFSALRETVSESLMARIEEMVAALPLVPLKRLGYNVTQGWSPEGHAYEPGEGEIGILKLSAVSSGLFKADDAKALPPELADRAEGSLVREGDLLMVRASGSLRLLGAVCRVEGLGARRRVFPDLVYRLEPRRENVDPKLIPHLLRTGAGRRAVSEAKRGAANNKLRQDDVRNLAIPAPVEQEAATRLAAMIDGHEPVTVALDAEIGAARTKLAAYRHALITEAVTGRLEVTRLSDAQLDESAHAAAESEQPEVLSR